MFSFICRTSAKKTTWSFLENPVIDADYSYHLPIEAFYKIILALYFSSNGAFAVYLYLQTSRLV